MRKIWFLAGIIIIIASVLVLTRFLRVEDVANTAYWMDGRIVEISDNAVIISGIARFLENGKERREERTIKFQLTPETKFQKTTTIIRRANKGFSSETTLGSISDLVQNIRIIKIESAQDLFTNKEANASYIDYEIVEIRD